MTVPNVAISATIAEYTNTIGTGTYSLRGALAGYFRFRDAHDDGDSFDYIVTDGPNVEIVTGTLTYGSPDSLSRDTIQTSSNNDNAVNWQGGTRPIIREIVESGSSSLLICPEANTDATVNQVLNWNGTEWCPDSNVVGSDAMVSGSNGDAVLIQSGSGLGTGVAGNIDIIGGDGHGSGVGGGYITLQGGTYNGDSSNYSDILINPVFNSSQSGDVLIDTATAVSGTNLRGAGFFFTGGRGDGSGIGGQFNVTAGDGNHSSNGAGGPITMVSGDGFGSGSGGDWELLSGTAHSTGSGGEIDIISGDGGSSSGTGGNVSISTGNGRGTNSLAGSLFIACGDSNGSGKGSDIQLQPGGTTTGAAGAVQIIKANTTSNPPGTPSAGFYLYIDPSDSKLKAKGTSGTVTILAIP